MIQVGKMIPYAFKMLFKKHSTELYPFVKKKVEEDFRGKLKFDPEKCIGCNICTKVCPSNAITIEKVSEEEKKFKAVVHLDRCIYCAQCVYSCPKHALESTKDFELANFSSDKMKVDI